MSNPALAASVWRNVAEIAVELGPVRTWVPSGPQWSVGVWGVDAWGSQYLTPSSWLDVTADVLTFDTDTGRNGLDDPGEVGTANLVLDDRAGAHGTGWNGALLRATSQHVASGERRVIFLGKIIEDHADSSLSAPTISIRAVDLVGAVLSSDDTEALLAQSVRERLDELLDRGGFPVNRRELADDPVALLGTDRPGSRLDAARGAASSSSGGTLYAQGDSIVYRHGAINLDPGSEARFSIGTVDGAVCPSTLAFTDPISTVLNVYSWANQDRNVPISAGAQDVDSIHRYGRRASVRTDLLNARADELDELVKSELVRTAWGGDAVDACEIPVHDEGSAELVLAALLDVCQFDYTGSDPFSGAQVIGSIAHHVSADAWTINLRTFAPTIGSLWGSARWGVSAWATASE